MPEAPPVAESVAEPPTVPEAGAVKLMVWVALGAAPTAIVCWTWGAAE
ncbi:MAG: hypothetical protein ABSE77_18820 [Acidimicrobiales bacterium]